MEEAWNTNIAENFNPSWINVIDYIIMGWYNKFVPGFMCVGRKTHPFGNDSHKICCGLTSILWRAHIVEGKDITAQLVPKIHSEFGRTIGIMLQICEPIFSIGKTFVMDSVFLLQMGLLYLQRRECMLALSSRSVGTGQKLLQGISSTVISIQGGGGYIYVGGCHRRH